jgi:hypothetical protein
MSRVVHVGCGIENPVLGGHHIWRLWTALVLAIVVSFPVDLLTDSLWGLFAYVPWLAVIAVAIRWEIVHSPAKMYRTWYP